MFSESDRAIFEYDTGAGKRFADPLAIYRGLVVRLDGDLAGAIEAAQPPEDPKGEDPGRRIVRLKAEERLLAAVRETFCLERFDPETGQGAHDRLTWRALNSYLEWCEGEGQGGESTPTSSDGSTSPSP